MIIGANIKEAVRSLLSSKQRTVLALIGIVIGIGSVIAMVSIGKIVQEESLRQFKEMLVCVETALLYYDSGTMRSLKTSKEYSKSSDSVAW